ncbi:MAG: DUF2795 domain-containing protein [Streptosporangiales bacterium]|nr:DUF2795 domain-containing protein [Streptosporangiales bacterium]
MTDQDEGRVAKVLQGIDFPADRDSLVAYAEARGANSKALEALRQLPELTYRSMDQVIDATPQEPEGDERGGVARSSARHSPTHRP